jgi:hypothetical protein
MSKGIVLWVWMSATVGLTNQAWADEAADIGRAFERAKEPTHQLLASHRNLNQMRKVLPSSDQEAIDAIIWAEDRFDGIRSELLTVSVIFKNMDSRSDKRFVGAIFEEDARSFIASANDAIEEINANLPSLSKRSRTYRSDQIPRPHHQTTRNLLAVGAQGERLISTQVRSRLRPPSLDGETESSP